MRFHNRAIDQVQTVARFCRQSIENTLPDSSPRPAVEPIVRTRVRAVAFGQIRPRDPGPQHVKYCIYDPAIVRARALPTLRHQPTLVAVCLLDYLQNNRTLKLLSPSINDIDASALELLPVAFESMPVHDALSLPSEEVSAGNENALEVTMNVRFSQVVGACLLLVCTFA